MKSTLTLHTALLRAPWFRSLPTDIRLFWLHLLGDCDTAGWWYPDWDVTQAWLRLPTPLDPHEVERHLVSAGQVRVHPSGWWELIDYQAQQYPRGLSPDQPYHRSVLRLEAQHHARERVLSARSTARALPEAGLGSDSSQEGQVEVSSASPTDGVPEDEPCIPDARRTKDQGQGPRPKARGLGLDTVPTGGLGGTDQPVDREGPLTELRLRLWANRINPGAPGIDEALTLLLDGLGLSGARDALNAWLSSSSTKTSKGLVAWVARLQHDCPHPEARRRWWTADAGPGLRQRHWRCLDCGTHGTTEPYSVPLPAAAGGAS